MGSVLHMYAFVRISIFRNNVIVLRSLCTLIILLNIKIAPSGVVLSLLCVSRLGCTMLARLILSGALLCCCFSVKKVALFCFLNSAVNLLFYVFVI